MKNVPKWPCTEHETFQIETLHQYLDTTVDLSQKVCARDENIFEDELACVGAAHTKLIQLASTRETLEVLFDDKRCDPLGALLGFRLGVYDNIVRVGTLDECELRATRLTGSWRAACTYVGDPHLCSIQYPTTIDFLSGCLHTDNIRASRVLRHGQGTDFLARKKTRQESLFLLR